MGKWFNGALKMRSAMDNACTALSDVDASRSVEMYPVMQYNGKKIGVGKRINWNGYLKQAAVDLWDTKENNPDNAPTLWVDILYKDGIRVIPNPITTPQVFGMDELGWWNNELYKSKLAVNVHTPEQNPFGWEKINS